MSNKRTLTVPGRYEQIQHICQFMADGARECGLDDSDIFHIELACDEACTNIIEHAYEGEDKGEIVVSWELSQNQFVITLHDQGQSFNPDDVPDPPPPPDPDATDQEIVDNLKIGGLGIHFMRKLMDDVYFEFSDMGNTLVLVKNLAASD